jgi:hypothetical protein
MDSVHREDAASALNPSKVWAPPGRQRAPVRLNRTVTMVLQVASTESLAIGSCCVLGLQVAGPPAQRS